LALQARTARAGGDARKAFGLYRALAEKGGAAGENAEYEMGRVLRDGLHQSREAVAVWRAYRASHPHGLLRIEADISVIETLVSLGDRTGAVAEASDFIRRYPESERRSEVARLAGDLFRERGECGDAIRAYDIALGRAHTGRDVADAPSFHRAGCLLRGDQTQGVAALRSYLDSFPSGRFRGEAQRLLNGPPSVEPPAVAPR
jgi:outer membrane protein assembly factor BamD (BamD/ComL family)